MKIYVLDWNGTLTTLGNPLVFVQSLQAMGHKVVMHSGQSGPDPAYNAVARICDDVVSKGGKGPIELNRRFDEDYPGHGEVVGSDDDWMGESFIQQAGWRYVHPEDLLAELTRAWEEAQSG